MILGPTHAQVYAELPGQGPLQKTRLCQAPDYRPGDSLYKAIPETRDRFVLGGRDVVFGNDCKPLFYHLDAAGDVIRQSNDVNLEALRRNKARLDALPKLHTLKRAPPRPLPPRWWEQPDLLPTRLERPLTLRDMFLDGSCKLSNGVAFAPNSIVIADETRAIFIGIDCRPRLLLEVPEAPAMASNRGTGVGTGQAEVVGPPGAQPATLVLVPLAPAAAQAGLRQLLWGLAGLFGSFEVWASAQMRGDCVEIELAPDDAAALLATSSAPAASAPEAGSSSPGKPSLPQQVKPSVSPPQAPPIPEDWIVIDNPKVPGGRIAFAPEYKGRFDPSAPKISIPHIRITPPDRSPVPGQERGYWRRFQGTKPHGGDGQWWNGVRNAWGGDGGAQSDQTHIPLPPGYQMPPPRG